jgi:hypothetical protein
VVPVRRQERPVIRLGNAHETVDAVRDEKPVGDLAPYGAARDGSRQSAMSLIVKNRGDAGMVTPPLKAAVTTTL